MNLFNAGIAHVCVLELINGEAGERMELEIREVFSWLLKSFFLSR
jgi:hypothetical protein